jgi:teichuronic acid biosynthesis glycosyltransferase TuaH
VVVAAHPPVRAAHRRGTAPVTQPGVDVVLALAYRTWADGLKVGFAYSPERICVQLRDDPTIPRLLVANPLRSRLGLLAGRGRTQAPSFSDDPTRRLAQPYRWRRGEPTDRDEAVRVYRRLDHYLQRRRDDADTVLVTCHPVLAAVADRDRWRDVVLYAWDDYRGGAGSWDLVQWAYDTLAERDVNVIGVTSEVLRRIGARRATVVPNGIVATEYDEAGPLPAWFSAVPGRIAFYAGSLQRRIDVDALSALARDLGPDWTLVLVGPMQDPVWFARLREEPNVVIREAEPRPVVLAMMADADVCLVPHVAGTEEMSPLKVYEYLGAGSPVVATDLEPMRGLSDRCLLVEPGGSLTPAVRRAAALPSESAAELAAFRAEHDWSSRYHDFRLAALGY